MDFTLHTKGIKMENKKYKKHTVLYLYESLAPALLFLVIGVVQLYFYFTGLNHPTVPSTNLDLFAAIVFFGLSAFAALYMGFRFITFTDEGIEYRSLFNKYFTPWDKVDTVKIMKNSFGAYGRGSYIILTNGSYSPDQCTWRVNNNDIAAIKYRKKLLEEIKKYNSSHVVNLDKIRAIAIIEKN